MGGAEEGWWTFVLVMKNFRHISVGFCKKGGGGGPVDSSKGHEIF